MSKIIFFNKQSLSTVTRTFLNKVNMNFTFGRKKTNALCSFFFSRTCLDSIISSKSVAPVLGLHNSSCRRYCPTEWVRLETAEEDHRLIDWRVSNWFARCGELWIRRWIVIHEMQTWRCRFGFWWSIESWQVRKTKRTYRSRSEWSFFS